MDNIAIESFIQHCDEMMIAEEGFGDKARKAGKWILEKLNTLWSNFMKFVNMVKNKVKSALRKMSGAENEEAKLKEKIASLEKAKKELESENTGLNAKLKVSYDKRYSEYKQNEGLSQLNKKLSDDNKKLRDDMNNLIDENKSTSENLERVTKELERTKKYLDGYERSYDVLKEIDTYVQDVLAKCWLNSNKQANESLNECREALSILKNIPVSASYEDVKSIMEKSGIKYFSLDRPPVRSHEKDRSTGDYYLMKFKDLIQSAKQCSEGKIQNTFILKQIEIFDNHIKKMESIKKLTESFVKEGDKIPNIYARDKFMLSMGKEISGLQKDINDATSYMKDLMSLLNDPEGVDW